MTEPEQQMRRRVFPCGPCPIRADNADNPDAKFPAERWDMLSDSVEHGEHHPQPGDMMFGCHKGEPGTDRDLACAGWLARFGLGHVGVRLAIAMGALPADAVRPGPNWPPLHATWDEVRRCQTSDG